MQAAIRDLNPSAIQRVLIFTSPMAGAGNRRSQIPDLAAALRLRGVDVQVSDQLGALLQFTAVVGSAAADPGDLVIAAGGDGTLGLVLDRTPPGTAIAIFPLGTENLVAKQFGIAADVDQMVQIVTAGQTVSIDAGLAVDPVSGRGKLFLVMLTCGFDAEVVDELHRRRSGFIRRYSYLCPIVKVLWRYRFPQITVEGDWSLTSNPAGSSIDATDADATDADAALPPDDSIAGRWVMAFNLPRYAAGLPIEPAADGRDGQLDLCVLPRGSLLSGVRYLVGIVFSWDSWLRDIRRQRFTACTIRSQQPVAYQLDGDAGGQLPVAVSVLPGRVRLRLPS